MRINPIEDYKGLIHRTAVIGRAGRMTETEYASKNTVPLPSVQKRFAATGKLECGDGSSLTAQLTGSSNTLTTAAHAFYDLKTCAERAEPTSCHFKVKVGDVEKVAKVSALSAIGTECPTLPMYEQDWAVLKIEPSLEDIDFYKLPNEPDLESYGEVISVAASAADFIKRDSKGKKINPKSIEECRIQAVTRMAGKPLLQSDCDTAQGSSGGSVLSSIRGRDVLIGINSNNDETDEQLKRALQEGKVNSGKFRKGEWATYHVPLAGDFLRAVENAAGGFEI